MPREFAEPGQLAAVVRAAYGPRRRLDRLDRLEHSTKKGVYRLAFDDGGTSILYLWSPAENFWPTGGGEGDGDGDGAAAGPLDDASGFELFAAGHAKLSSLGVPVPELHLLAGGQELYPAELAVVEDVRGGTLEDLLGRDPARAEPALDTLAGAVEIMHRQRSRPIGRLAGADRAGQAGSAGGSGALCVEIVLERALRDLDYAAGQVERLAAGRDRLAGTVRELAARVRPRTEHGLIHGELGPDHVMIREDGRPVLVDIEGVMFFDVEWEHVFMALRFGQHYRRLRLAGLDEQRLEFYALAMHLSLVAGPLRLLAGDYPDRAPFLRIIEHNTTRALGFLGPARRD
jgi:Phosphotransferase enzyme family